MKEESLFEYFPFTPISNNFIEKYMIDANPVFTVIYIYLLKKFINRDEINLDKVCNKMDILQSDMIKCLNYWKEKGLINFEINENILNIKFINKFDEKPSKVIIQKEKGYTDDEITMFSQKEEVQQLFRIAENKFARTLTYQDRKRIIELFYGYGITMEIFVMLLTYCKEKGKDKLNFNYIEKVAIDWIENEIDTPQKVENYVKLYDENFKKIMTVFGIGNNLPAPIQIDYMKRWILEFKMPIDVIEEACRITMLQTGRPRFDYAEKVLQNWINNDIKTLEDVNINREKFKLEKQMNDEEMKKKIDAINKQKVYQQPQRKNKFINFDQPKVDFKKLRELEIKNLKGEI